MSHRGSPALLLALLVACDERGKQATPAASAAAAPSLPVSAAPIAAASSAPAPPVLAAAGCRVLSLRGEAKLGDAALASGALLDGSDWVRLAAKAKLTLKHVSSGRELQLQGPALFRACQRGREQVLLAQGSVTTTASVGARPGAEVLLATPVAAVRYADAELTLTLDQRSLAVAVRAGSAEIDPFPSPRQPIKSPLGPKQKLTLPLGKPDPQALLAACKEAAEHAAASARRVTDPSASAPLGERAKLHVQARQTARASCSVAAAATGLVADPSASAGLWAEAAKWTALWEIVPQRPRAQAPEK